ESGRGAPAAPKQPRDARIKEALGPLGDVDALWRLKQKGLTRVMPLLRRIERELGRPVETGGEAAPWGEVASAAVEYRNKFLGHGAARASGPAADVGRLFEEALFELFAQATFLKTHRLVHVDAIERGA